jgi:subtilisin family serine protease
MTGGPWRGSQQAPFPGIPAWGASTASTPLEQFDVTPFPEITPGWAWGDADGSGVRVAVVDSGVDGGHPFVGGLDRAVRLVPGADGHPVVADCEAADIAGHGTACAGIIRSIAPRASLTSVQVLTDGKFGSGAALLAGLSWAIDEGFDVINLSLSTTKPQFHVPLRELADSAYFRRSLLVVSAHNMPVHSYPWPFSSVVSVACHDETGPMAYYYNPTPPVEFYARGVGVTVAWINGRTRRGTGNSFAAPHITGICSLILSKHPWLTPFQLKTVLYLSASNVARLTGGIHASQ